MISPLDDFKASCKVAAMTKPGHLNVPTTVSFNYQTAIACGVMIQQLIQIAELAGLTVVSYPAESRWVASKP